VQTDITLITVFVALLAGTIWAFDAWGRVPKKTRRQVNERVDEPQKGTGERVTGEKGRPQQKHVFVQFSRRLFPVLVVVLLIRTFVIEPFRIPTESMMPTLRDGDFILVNKFIYGIHLPIINQIIVDVDSPDRGDVAVFRYPKDPDIEYIKRVIGLPGDRISYRNKILSINGKVMAQEGYGVYEPLRAGTTLSSARVFDEDLEGIKHALLIDEDKPVLNFDYTVGENEYFVMGDNRDNSNDSRFWGPVPEENLVGRAFMIWMSWDSTLGKITWSRIGQRVD